jgi:hypothetical protein
MLQPSLRKWLGASVLGSALMVGCSHSKQCTSCSANRQVSPGYVTMLPTSPYQAPVTYAQAPVMPVQPPVQKAEAVPTMLPPAMPPAQAPTPEPVAATAPAPVAQASAVEPSKSEKDAFPVSYSLTGGEEKPVARRSYADITAKPCYAHAPDYSWVSGELQFVHSRNEWRVRYASVDEEDRYGGSLTLIEMGPMTDHKDGEYVRVSGQVTDGDSREPHYRVGSIEALPSQP